MVGFRKLLLAIDLSPASTALIRRVIQMYPDDLDKVHIVHVIKPVIRLDADTEEPDLHDPDIQREMNYTRQRILELLHTTGLDCAAEKFYVMYGEPSYQIKSLARAIAADLVIVGSHSKEDDWLHLPGATTNCVIQGSSSDVMAIKV